MAQAPYTVAAQQIPGEVYQQAAAQQLGEVTNSYKPKYSNPLVIIGAMIGVIILDIVVFLALIILTDYIFYILVVIPIIAIVYGIAALVNCNLRAYTFGQGLVLARVRSLQIVRWDQIEAIWHKTTTQRRSGVVHSYTIRSSDGKEIKIGGGLGNAFVRMAELGLTIQSEVAKIQLPRVIESYRGGSTISFGKVNVNMQGINNGKQIIPWDQIGTLEVSQGLLVIRKDGRILKWSAVKTQQIPNLYLLMQLVQYVTGGQQ